MLENNKESMKALIIELFDALTPQGREILFDEVIAHVPREKEEAAQT